MDRSSLTIVPVEAFEPPAGTAAGQAGAEHRRRFSTLLLDEGAPVVRGGFAVQKAHTADNRAVGLCFAWEPGEAGGSGSPRAGRAVARRRVRAECDELVRLSVFRCFPKAHGVGEVRGEPVLVEDWVDGPSLRDVARMLAESGGVEGAEGPAGPAGMNPVDVAVIGAKLYGLLEAIEGYGGSALRGVSPDAVLLDCGRGGVGEALATRGFELRIAAVTGPACDPADFLLGMLGASGAPVSAGAFPTLAPTRDEREALARALRHGREQGYGARDMKCMLARWVRVHDGWQMAPDGSVPYPVRLDPHALIPLARAAERPRLGFASHLTAGPLDNAEGNVDWVEGERAARASAPARDRFRWWLARNLIPAWTALMLVWAVVAFCAGWLVYAGM